VLRAKFFENFVDVFSLPDKTPLDDISDIRSPEPAHPQSQQSPACPLVFDLPEK
jgi:hypothetical protein